MASYRVAPLCRITDVSAVGDYTYGIGQLQAEIRGFQSEQLTRRFVRDTYQYRRQRHIILHRALEERPATLVCETDMLDTRVFSAYIRRSKRLDNGKWLDYREPVEVSDGRLPDLGIYTYSRDVSYTTDQCR